MSPIFSGKQSLSLFLLVLLIAAILLGNLLLHEFGHCLSMEIAGGACEGLYVWPGIKVWPLAQVGQPYAGKWNQYLGLTQFAAQPPDDFGRGFVFLMGSGTTALAALTALLALWLFHPRGWLRTGLLIQALCFVDILFYTILPEWFGLRHYLFIGGTSSEPLQGALLMGLPKNGFIAVVLGYALLMSIGWGAYLRHAQQRQP